MEKPINYITAIITVFLILVFVEKGVNCFSDKVTFQKINNNTRWELIHQQKVNNSNLLLTFKDDFCELDQCNVTLLSNTSKCNKPTCFFKHTFYNFNGTCNKTKQIYMNFMFTSAYIIEMCNYKSEPFFLTSDLKFPVDFINNRYDNRYSVDFKMISLYIPIIHLIYQMNGRLEIGVTYNRSTDVYYLEKISAITYQANNTQNTKTLKCRYSEKSNINFVCYIPTTKSGFYLVTLNPNVPNTVWMSVRPLIKFDFESHPREDMTPLINQTKAEDIQTKIITQITIGLTVVTIISILLLIIMRKYFIKQFIWRTIINSNQVDAINLENRQDNENINLLLVYAKDTDDFMENIQQLKMSLREYVKNRNTELNSSINLTIYDIYSSVLAPEINQNPVSWYLNKLTNERCKILICLTPNGQHLNGVELVESIDALYNYIIDHLKNTHVKINDIYNRLFIGKFSFDTLDYPIYDIFSTYTRYVIPQNNPELFRDICSVNSNRETV